MYLPYMTVTAQEDRIGNLQIWVGNSLTPPSNEEQIAYIQTAQDRETIFSACFGLEEEEKEEIKKGYAVTLQLHEDYVMDILS